MPTEIYLLKVGMTMTEGMVAEWYVTDGGAVAQGEPLYRMETEKVSMDVEAPATGIVRQTVGENVRVAPASVIGYLYGPEEAVPAQTPQSSGPVRAVAAGALSPIWPVPPVLGQMGGDGKAPVSPIARRLARELGVELEVVRGTGPGGRVVESDIRAAHEAQLERVDAAGRGLRVSPVARRMAEMRGVDLRAVKGTGPGGRIVKEDVEAASAAQALAVPVEAPHVVAPRAPSAERLPVRGMRRTIAQRMYESLRTTAQLTMDMEVRMDEAVRLRGRLIGEWAAEGIRPTYTDLVIKAVAHGLIAHRRMNAWFEADQIVLGHGVHVGVAVALDEGLVVPVIRDADRMTLKQIAAELARLAKSARDGTLDLDGMKGGTFTVTTLGGYGVDSFTPILNLPQVGILGVNRVRETVGWEGERPVRRQVMNLSLTWDHRAVDGVPAALFLGTVRDLLEAPHQLLA